MAKQFDFDTPEGRYTAAEALGPDGYNAAIAAYHKATFVEIVNGYGLRWVNSRFGSLCAIYKTNVAYKTIDEARRVAATLPKGDAL